MGAAKGIPLNDILNSPLNHEREEVAAGTSLKSIGKDTGMKIHIEINTSASDGNTMRIEADACNQSDLDAIHAKYHEYMPKEKNFLQKLLRW
ncbi:hypothetical protein M0R72_15250 [Candidatus Pacearchaeota archaeon]|jgi:hypothetical protein|nr:hypothetical protein [Candidatus Pacearchaeota archaeon]